MQDQGRVRVSARQFAFVAGFKIEIWQQLINHPLHHQLYGEGRVVSVNKKSQINIKIQFEKPSNGALERTISSLEFVNGQVDGLWLPPDLIEQWKSILKPIREPEKSNPTQQKPIQNSAGMNGTQKPGSPSIQPGAGRISSKKPVNNQSSRPAKVIQVRCPYCPKHFSVQEINPHIHREHPLNKQGRPTSTPTPVAKHSKESDPINKPRPIQEASKPFFICPYCEAFVKPKNFSGHIQRVHPGNPIPEKPEATALRTHRKQKQELPPSVAAPEHTERPPRWGRCSGGVKIPTSMRTLSVGKRRGAVIRRKSY